MLDAQNADLEGKTGIDGEHPCPQVELPFGNLDVGNLRERVNPGIRPAGPMNDDALSAFMERHDGFAPVPFDKVLEKAGLGSLKGSVRPTAHGLQLTPHKTGTDGFYAAILVRNP